MIIVNLNMNEMLGMRKEPVKLLQLLQVVVGEECRSDEIEIDGVYVCVRDRSI